MEDLTKWRWGKGSIQGRDEGEAGLCGLLRGQSGWSTCRERRVPQRGLSWPERTLPTR